MYKKVNVEDLKGYENNSRTHSVEQIEQLVKSINEFGFTNPILIDNDNMIIAGHARLEAAKKSGMDEVPCIVLSELSEEKKKAYIIADNKLALNAGWDMDILQSEFISLKDFDFDLELTGFSLEEIHALDDDVDIDFPSLNSGEKEPYQQKTFYLHDEQIKVIEDAIVIAKKQEGLDTGLNDNSNGNALFLICNEWLNGIHEKS